MNLKQFRIDYKLGQSALAELFGCKQANISNIENGVRKITRPQLMTLIENYGIDKISPYLEPDDSIPAATVNIDMHKTSVGDNNNGPVNAGNGNQTVSPDAGLISVMQSQAAHITELLKQQDRLIKLLEERK